MSNNLDKLYIKSNKALKHLSMLQLPTNHKILLQDLYLLVANIEYYYYLESMNLFISTNHKKQYVNENITKFKYTLDIYKEIVVADRFSFKKVKDVLSLYSERVPTKNQLREFSLDKSDLDLPVNADFVFNFKKIKTASAIRILKDSLT